MSNPEDAGTRRATQQRHAQLLALLRAGVDGVEALAGRVGVSASTVRRDLSRLEREGRIARTYGGALVRDDVLAERSFGESARLHAAAKAAVAAAAAELVPAGGTVFLDAGTTCLALARVLAGAGASSGAGSLTVVTRGLEAALLLVRSPDVRVVVVGGSVQPLSHGLVGPLASIALDRLSFDVAFLGADTVDAERGLGEPTVDETFVKEMAAGRAQRVVLLADASKFAAGRAPAWLRIDPAWTLVTDGAAPPEATASFSEQGVGVVVAAQVGG